MEDKFEFDADKHEYKINSEVYGGVTTVLNVIAKPALIPWAAGEVVKYIESNCPKSTDNGVSYIVTEAELKKAKSAHRKKKEKAADWGSLVHKALEQWIRTKSLPSVVELGKTSYKLEADHTKACENFITWATTNNVEFLLSEKGIYSKEWKLGGTVDFVCNINGKRYVGDIKTSSGIYESYYLQTAAYAKMLMEMGLYDKFDRMVIVNIKKDGTMDVEERKDVLGNIECFKAALVLHNRFKE